VLWHDADHADDSVPLDDLALVANLFDAGPNFHANFFSLLRLYLYKPLGEPRMNN